MTTAAPQPPKLRESPAHNPAVRFRRFGDDDRQPLRFYVYQDVLDELVYSAKFDRRPFVAILLGGFGVEERRAFIEVNGFAGATWAEDLPDVYPALKEVCDEWVRRPAVEDALAGLFVSVPGCSAQVTAEMLRLHLSLFNVPFQPLIVLDPEQGRLTVNARAALAPMGNAAFCVVAERVPLNTRDESGTPRASEEE